jgi:HSP20 family molecular chaperone IbpA
VFRFDVDIDSDAVKAEITDGLLRLEVPKVKARDTSRRVRVTRRDQ